MAVSASGTSIALLIRHRERYDFANMDIKKDVRNSWRIGRWLFVGSLLHLGSLYIFPWVLYGTTSDVEAGKFAACYTLVNLINPLILGFTNYFRPKIMQVYVQDGLTAMCALVNKVMLAFLPIALLGVLVLWVLGGWGIALLYGDAFAGLDKVIGITGLALIGVVLGAPLQLAMIALNRPETNPQFHFASLLTALIVGIPLITAYGKIGAAIGFSLSVNVGFVVLYIRYIQVTRQTMRDARA